MASSVPQFGLHRDVANSRVALNYAGTRRFHVNGSGASVNGTFGSSGALTVTAGDLTVSAGALTVTGNAGGACTAGDSHTFTTGDGGACAAGGDFIVHFGVGCCCDNGTLRFLGACCAVGIPDGDCCGIDAFDVGHVVRRTVACVGEVLVIKAA
jgi:hypothetical protein